MDRISPDLRRLLLDTIDCYEQTEESTFFFKRRSKYILSRPRNQHDGLLLLVESFKSWHSFRSRKFDRKRPRPDTAPALRGYVRLPTRHARSNLVYLMSSFISYANGVVLLLLSERSASKYHFSLNFPLPPPADRSLSSVFVPHRVCHFPSTGFSKSSASF